MLRYVTVSKFATESGYSEDAIRTKIRDGVWREGQEWKKAPDGRILIDVEGYTRWVETGELSRPRQGIPGKIGAGSPRPLVERRATGSPPPLIDRAPSASRKKTNHRIDMKLPEYDNRPSAGEPLYENKKASEWDDIKFPLLAVALPILALIFFGAAAFDLLDAVKALFR